MRTIETAVFKFEELSESAKEKARAWYREDLPVGYDFVFEDAANIAEIFGLDIRQTRRTRMDGSHYYVPTVYFSGVWSQGDGACFEGTYKYKKGASKAIRQYSSDKELHRIVDGLQAIQRRHFYKLSASTNQSGFYYHSGCMSVDVEHIEDRYRDIGDAEEDIRQLMRDFADWIYKQLKAEYYWANSDEYVDENIRVNEYDFTEEGDIA